MEQQIEIHKLKEWVGELYLEKKLMEKIITSQAEELEVFRKGALDGVNHDAQ
ncbi:MAG: hypothetical protein RBT11_14195 [Desulfobacterales bacterium]|jgi:hypothetical protein|nr:hypothetical protein [Desulfobacterales bacterium]